MRSPDDPRGILGLQAWRAVVRESTSSACFPPGSFIARSLSKQSARSPPQTASACWVRSETPLATRGQVWAGDSTAPTPDPSSHQLGTLVLPLPTLAGLGPAAGTTATAHHRVLHRQGSRPGRNKASSQRYFFQSPELILMGRTWVMCPFLSQSLWWGWSGYGLAGWEQGPGVHCC